MFGMVLATEINALRLEIVDGVNQLLKLPLISYVIDNTKTMINQVITNCIIIVYNIVIILLYNLKRIIVIYISRTIPLTVFVFVLLDRVVLRIH